MMIRIYRRRSKEPIPKKRHSKKAGVENWFPVEEIEINCLESTSKKIPP